MTVEVIWERGAQTFKNISSVETRITVDQGNEVTLVHDGGTTERYSSVIATKTFKTEVKK